MSRSEESARRDRRVEMLAAVLLSMATIVTAWSAYQATRWSGVQADSYSRAAALRTESVRSSTTANRQGLIDVQIFLDWLDAYRNEDQELMGFLEARMREEFLPAFNAWLETGQEGGDLPAGTPFALEEYRLAAQDEAAGLETQAAVAFDEAREANQVADDFVLAAVLFASVLFFAGLAGTFDSVRAQILLLVLGGLMFLLGLVVVVTLPQNVGF